MRAVSLVVALALVGCVEPRVIEGPALEDGEVAIAFFVGAETTAYVVEEGAALERAFPTDTADVYLLVYRSIEEAQVSLVDVTTRRLEIDLEGKKGQAIPRPGRIWTRGYASEAGWTELAALPSPIESITIECADGTLTEAGCGCEVEASLHEHAGLAAPEGVELVAPTCPFGVDRGRCVAPAPIACADPLQRWSVANARCEALGSCAMTWPATMGTDVVYVRAGSAGNGTRMSPVGTLAEAVTLSNPGGTIAITRGTYDADVQIAKDLEILGLCASEVSLRGDIEVVGARVRIAALGFEDGNLSSVDGMIVLDQVATTNAGLSIGPRASLHATDAALSSSRLASSGEVTLTRVGIQSEAREPAIRILGGQTSLVDSSIVAVAGAVLTSGQWMATGSVVATESVGVQAQGDATVAFTDSAVVSTQSHAIEHLSTGDLSLRSAVVEAGTSESAIAIADGALDATGLTLGAPNGITATNALVEITEAAFAGDRFIDLDRGSLTLTSVNALVARQAVDADVDTASLVNLVVRSSARSSEPAIRLGAEQAITIDRVELDGEFPRLIDATSTVSITIASLVATQAEGTGAASILTLESRSVAVLTSNLDGVRDVGVQVDAKAFVLEDVVIRSPPLSTAVRQVVLSQLADFDVVRLERVRLDTSSPGFAVLVPNAAVATLSDVDVSFGVGHTLQLRNIDDLSMTNVRVVQPGSAVRSVGIDVTAKIASLEQIEIEGSDVLGTGLLLGTTTSSLTDVRIAGWHSALAIDFYEPDVPPTVAVEAVEVTAVTCGYCAKSSLVLDAEQVCGGLHAKCDYASEPEDAACSAP